MILNELSIALIIVILLLVIGIAKCLIILTQNKKVIKSTQNLTDSEREDHFL